jgi:hypothetical protein
MGKGLGRDLKPLPDEKLDSLVQDLEVELRETGAFFPMRYAWGGETSLGTVLRGMRKERRRQRRDWEVY